MHGIFSLTHWVVSLKWSTYTDKTSPQASVKTFIKGFCAGFGLFFVWFCLACAFRAWFGEGREMQGIVVRRTQALQWWNSHCQAFLRLGPSLGQWLMDFPNELTQKHRWGHWAVWLPFSSSTQLSQTPLLCFQPIWRPQSLPAYAAFGQTGFGQKPKNSISPRTEINE